MNRLKTNKCIRTTIFNKLSYQVRHTLMWARKFPLELFIVERVFPILGQSFTWQTYREFPSFAEGSINLKNVLEFIVKHYATRWQYEMDEQSIQDSFHDPHILLYVTQFRLLSLYLCLLCDTCFLYLAPCTVIHVKCSPSPNIQVKLSQSI
jgi:hypothetical protein